MLDQYAVFLRAQERPAVRAVRAEIRGLRQDSLIRSLANAQTALSNLYGTREASRVLQAMLTGSAAAAFGKVLARRAALTPLDPRSVHRMRVAFKKFRYIVELTQPFLPWVDRKHGRAMDEFQTAMGEIQDLEVLAAGLRRFAQRNIPMTAPLFLPVFRSLASVRTVRMNAFLHSADHLEIFWR